MVNYGFWALVTDYAFRIPCDRFSFLALMADSGFWAQLADFGFRKLVPDLGFWTLEPAPILDFRHFRLRTLVKDFGF